MVFPLGTVSMLSGVLTWVSRTTRNSDFAILYGVFGGFYLYLRSDGWPVAMQLGLSRCKCKNVSLSNKDKSLFYCNNNIY